MPAVSHAKSDTIGDVTGTVTVYNSAGATTTVAATDLVRPSDWNSAHNQYLTLAGNTAGDASTWSGTNLVFAGGNNATVSLATAAGAATMSLVGGGGATLSGYAPYDDFELMTGANVQGSLIFDPAEFPNMTWDRWGVLINNTNSSNSSGSHSLTFRVGIYTRNVSTLSLLMSASMTTALTHSGTQGSYSLFSGMRLLTSGWSTSLAEGRYYLAQMSSTASAGTNGSYSQFVISNIATNFTGVFGVAPSNTVQLRIGQGFYTAATNGMPNSVALSQINGSNSLAFRAPYIQFGYSTF